MFELLLQEYKPYMFWMNMIDAFYQSLICFFIPYFVSLILFFCAFVKRKAKYEDAHDLLQV